MITILLFLTYDDKIIRQNRYDSVKQEFHFTPRTHTLEMKNTETPQNPIVGKRSN